MVWFVRCVCVYLVFYWFVLDEEIVDVFGEEIDEEEVVDDVE